MSSSASRAKHLSGSGPLSSNVRPHSHGPCPLALLRTSRQGVRRGRPPKQVASRALGESTAEASAAAELASRRQGPSDFGFLIFDVASTRIAGYIEITNIVRGPLQSGYLGYYMFKGFEGRGYMKWALATIVKRAWEVHKLHRLEANIQPGNVASIGLVKVFGFHQEGYSPRYLKLRGRWRDHERWAVLAR
ncbi:MAG: GNAT family N-acetyltransferase [Piscinibacter sp.]|nr:GNAT family N-acetyltransferase [Piscinibacter sp.]